MSQEKYLYKIKEDLINREIINPDFSGQRWEQSVNTFALIILIKLKL